MKMIQSRKTALFASLFYLTLSHAAYAVPDCWFETNQNRDGVFLISVHRKELGNRSDEVWQRVLDITQKSSLYSKVTVLESIPIAIAHANHELDRARLIKDVDLELQELENLGATITCRGIVILE